MERPRPPSSLWLLGLSLWLASCGAGQPGHLPIASSPSSARLAERGFEVSDLTVTLSGPWAARYGGGATHALGPAEAFLVELLARSGASHDPALSQVSRELARTAPEANLVPGDLLDEALAWAGLVDPRPRLTMAEFGDPDHRCGELAQGEGCQEGLRSIGEALFALLAGESVAFGVGLSPAGEGLTRLMVAVSERRVELDPLPLVVDANDQVTVSGRLLGGFRAPRIELVDALGQWRSEEASSQGDRFSARVGCGGEGVARIEVLAEGGFGSQVVANFPVYCGVTPPGAVTIELERLAPEVTLDDVVRVSLELLNETRRRAGQEPLVWSEEAAAVARAHSEEMAQLGYVGHRSPRTGSASDRFRRAGLAYSVVRENIARGYGPLGMHRGLMNSPGHRANLLADEVTEVGIGAAWATDLNQTEGSSRPILLTQNFFAPRGADLPAEPAAALHQAIIEARAAEGLQPARFDEALARAAQQLAEGVAAGREAQARQRYDSTLVASRFRRVQTNQITAGRFTTLAELELFRGPLPGALGLGLAQITSGERSGSLVLVIAIGQ